MQNFQSNLNSKTWPQDNFDAVLARTSKPSVQRAGNLISQLNIPQQQEQERLPSKCRHIFKRLVFYGPAIKENRPAEI